MIDFAAYIDSSTTWMAMTFVVPPKLVFPNELISIPSVATHNYEKPTEGEKPKAIKVSKTDRTIWLPDANRGIAVLGGTGSGKTYGVIDPAIRSVIAVFIIFS